MDLESFVCKLYDPQTLYESIQEVRSFYFERPAKTLTAFHLPKMLFSNTFYEHIINLVFGFSVPTVDLLYHISVSVDGQLAST